MHLRSDVPPTHASAAILGTERMGAGTVVDPLGVVLTAHYMVIGARSVEVTSTDGTVLPGTVVGIDYATGLAAVRVEGARLPGLRIRPASADLVGEEAFVIASVGDGRRVSSGVLTSYAPFEAFWEYMLDHAITASAPSPGLGGGPLIDALGRMLGVVSLSLAEVGKFTLAVPAAEARPMLDAIERSGRYATAAPRAWIGITCYPIGRSVIVAAVLPESPAEAAEIASGDVIEAVDGVEVTDRRSLYSAIWSRAPGRTVRVRVGRAGESLEIAVEASSIESFFA